MHYLADTANVEELEKLLYYFPIEGITTNPTILAAEGKKLSYLLPILTKLAEGKMIHVQMISSQADRMVEEAEVYRNMVGEKCDFYAKIPVTEEGFRAMSMIKKRGIKVTATAVFTHQQGLVAARSGADFVAPYVNRLDNISSHGIEVVGDIVKTFKDFNIPTKVLAASFKTVDQIHRVTLTGCDSATISFELLERLRSHPMTDMSVKKFEEDGEDLYDIKY